MQSFGRLALLAVLSTGSAQHVMTPRGHWPEECVKSVPSGTQVRETATGVHLTYPNGTAVHHGNCSAGDGRAQLRARGGHGYPLLIEAQSNSWTQFTSTYNVPRSPASNDGQVLFWWIGAEPSTYSSVIQPVLGYEEGSWSYRSWNCCPAGHQIKANAISVREGDQLGAQMTKGGDGYTVTSTANGEESVLLANDQSNYPVIMLSLETYNVAGSCSLMPQSCMYMDSIALDSGSPSWGSNQPQGWDPRSCGWTIQLEGGSLKFCPPAASSALVNV